ncbi:hypothetical protein MMC28_006938 [Mycoblastus sanguinarius]|nr:hypothetical protein [Mycoblastus sanguinarius]
MSFKSIAVRIVHEAYMGMTVNFLVAAHNGQPNIAWKPFMKVVRWQTYFHIAQIYTDPALSTIETIRVFARWRQDLSTTAISEAESRDTATVEKLWSARSRQSVLRLWRISTKTIYRMLKAPKIPDDHHQDVTNPALQSFLYNPARDSSYSEPNAVVHTGTTMIVTTSADRHSLPKRETKRKEQLNLIDGRARKDHKSRTEIHRHNEASQLAKPCCRTEGGLSRSSSKSRTDNRASLVSNPQSESKTRAGEAKYR